MLDARFHRGLLLLVTFYAVYIPRNLRNLRNIATFVKYLFSEI